MTGFEPISPVISVDGTPLSAHLLSLLVSMRVQRRFRLPARLTLRLVDAGYELSSTTAFAIGRQIKVTMPGGTSLITAIVTGMNLLQSEGDHPELVVIADDMAHKLSRGSKVQTYVDVTWSDIVRRVAGEAGLLADVESTSSVQPYVLQADTDLAFIDDIATRIGFDWWVDDQTLHFHKPAAGTAVARLTLGETLYDFSVKATGLRPSSVDVTGWDSAQQAAISATGSGDTGTLVPNSDFVQPFLKSQTALGAAPVLTGAVHPLTQSEADTSQQALRGQWAASAVNAEGSCVANAALRPGSSVEVANAGPVSGTYHLTSVEHRYDHRGFRSFIVAGDRLGTSLADTLSQPRRGGSFNIPGLRIGIVTNINDPDKLGRVKVKYPGVSDAIEGHWARLLMAGAGEKRGMVFQPEVNDEVLVGFEGGDPRLPIVLGGLFSSRKSPGEWGTDQQKVKWRRIISRLGHTVELGDGADEQSQHILLTLAGEQHKIRLGKDRVDIQVPAGKPVSVKSGQASFEIDAGENVTIKGKKVTISADTEVDIKGQSKVAIQSSGQLQIQGATFAVKAQGLGNVEASGPLSIKGAIVAIN